mgnify:CR=1 FL=1
MRSFMSFTIPCFGLEHLDVFRCSPPFPILVKSIWMCFNVYHHSLLWLNKNSRMCFDCLSLFLVLVTNVCIRSDVYHHSLWLRIVEHAPVFTPFLLAFRMRRVRILFDTSGAPNGCVFLCLSCVIRS